MGRALERLLEQLRRRAQVALFSSGFGVSETTLGDQVPRREGIARQAYFSSFLAYAGAVRPVTSCFEAGGYAAFRGSGVTNSTAYKRYVSAGLRQREREPFEGPAIGGAD